MTDTPPIHDPATGEPDQTPDTPGETASHPPTRTPDTGPDNDAPIEGSG